MRPLVILLVVAVGFVLLAWLGQRRLLYFPSQVVPPAPADVREVVLPTADGLDLDAWLVPAAVTTPAVPAGTTVVVFHGNGGNRAGRLPLGRALADMGADALLVDYRGYGANPGSPTAHGLALDARAALDWVDETAGADPPTRTVLFGESLGAAVAIEVATDRPVAALVLRSPFASTAAIAREHYPVVPGWFLRDRWPSDRRVADLDLPVLVVAGDADRIVPLTQSRTIHEAAADSRLVVVEGAGHNDRALLHGDVLVDEVRDFLVTHLAG